MVEKQHNSKVRAYQIKSFQPVASLYGTFEKTALARNG